VGRGLGALLLRPARRARGEARPPDARVQAGAARVPGTRPAPRELRARGERAALRRGHARRSLRHVRERLPPLGQRLSELDPGAARAHRPGARGEGAHPGRERGRVLPAARLSMAADDLGTRLERFVGERLGAPARVAHPEPPTGGFPPETFGLAERAALGPEVAHARARLHAIDWRARGFQFLGAPRPGREAAERELARWEERIRRSGLPVSPPLAEALLWCRRHAPATDAI